MLMGSNYPQFTCPNCRAVTDLEAELDVEEAEEWGQVVDEPAKAVGNSARNVAPSISSLGNEHDTVHVGGAAQAYDEASDLDLANIQFEGNADQAAAAPQAPTNSLQSRRQTIRAGASLAIGPVSGSEMPRSSNTSPFAQALSYVTGGTLRAATPTSADIIGGEGPLTPRNNAGPFVFDGSAGRVGGRHLTSSVMDESE